MQISLKLGINMPVDKGYEKSAKYYDLFDDKPNINFFVDFAKQYKSILDIGAGTGRIAIPIAQTGVKVVCIEPSRAMRSIFQEKLSYLPHLKEKIAIVNSEADNFHLSEFFPAAILSGCFDHFLTPSERYQALVNIFNHLDPKGRILFDVFLGAMKDQSWIPAGEKERDEKTIKRLLKTECLKNNILKVTLLYQVYKNDEKISEDIQLSQAAITTLEEIEILLSKVGFNITNKWGSYQRTPFVHGGKLLILEAKRE